MEDNGLAHKNGRAGGFISRFKDLVANRRSPERPGTAKNSDRNKSANFQKKVQDAVDKGDAILGSAPRGRSRSPREMRSEASTPHPAKRTSKFLEKHPKVLPRHANRDSYVPHVPSVPERYAASGKSSSEEDMAARTATTAVGYSGAKVVSISSRGSSPTSRSGGSEPDSPSSSSSQTPSAEADKRARQRQATRKPLGDKLSSARPALDHRSRSAGRSL